MPRTSDRIPKIPKKPARVTAWQGVEQGWTVLSELIAAIAVWGGIGYGLDRLLGTWPVLFAIGMVLGYGGGAYLVYRQAFSPQASAKKQEPRT